MVRGEGVCGQNICFHAAVFCDSLKLDMQHDHVLKNLMFDLLTPSPWLGVDQGSAGKLFASMLLYFVILFSFISNITMF